jgi:hypothetical protein
MELGCRDKVSDTCFFLKGTVMDLLVDGGNPARNKELGS